MDPSDIKKTSFCGKVIDNVTSNDMKQYILNDLKNKTGIQYKQNYAKLYNSNFSQNLNNPHILCLKSFGAPYLLYCTKVNHVNYCFLIDKKVKSGYTYPKIFVVQYRFDDDIYYGTLFETELLRTKSNQWLLMLADIYYYKDVKYMKSKSIIERINTIHTLLKDEYLKDSFCDVCPIQVKKYFNMFDITLIKEFIHSLDYKIKGYYYIPLNINYANILYMFDDNYMKSIYKQTMKYINFKVTKGNKPEVYELYLQGSDGYKKVNFAHIPDIKTSHFLHNLFETSNPDKEHIVKCRYNSKFKKWIPFESTNDRIHHLNDLQL